MLRGPTLHFVGVKKFRFANFYSSEPNAKPFNCDRQCVRSMAKFRFVHLDSMRQTQQVLNWLMYSEDERRGR